MSLEHEYALLGGYNRSAVGKWIARASATLSAAAVFVLLSAIDLARSFGINANLPPAVLSLVGAGMVYTLLYWLFDHYAWRIGPLGRLLKVPHLAGSWVCEGVSLDKNPPFPWNARITIVQSWDRIRVHLETSQSSSDSVAAALLYDAAVGYRLLYHYRNHPRVGETDLAAHHGFAELVFAPDGSSASGEYFNGRGRNTFGTMKLVKEAK
jgi:hypothetical protein